MLLLVRKVKCVLCNGNHHANYEGWTIYKDLQEKEFPQIRQWNKDEVNGLDKQQQQTNFNSYADALRSAQITNKPTSELSELKSVMKTFMEQMSTMMTLTTTLVSSHKLN